MKLLLVNNQSKGMLGGVSFEVKAQIQLSEKELQLVQYYKLNNEVLLSRPITNIWGQPTSNTVVVRLGEMLQGTTFKCKDLGEVITYGESAKAACVTLKTYLAVASTFGGQEIIDFDKDPSDEGEQM